MPGYGPGMASAQASDYVARAAEAYAEQLRAQVARYGTPALDPEIAGRRAAVLAAAGQAWDADAGPFYDTEGARVALGGVSKQAVSQRVAAGRLLGLRLAADSSGRDRLVYPVWQFHTEVRRQLPAVLTACGYDPVRPVTGWTVAAWLTTESADLHDLAPVALLRAGRPEPVLAVAREVAASLGTGERAAARAHR